MDFKKFRANIKWLRRIKDITATELSIKANLKQPKRVADIEDGRGLPTTEELFSICSVLEITVDDAVNKEIVVSYNFK